MALPTTTTTTTVMTTTTLFSLLLSLTLATLPHLAAGEHCTHNLTKPDQVIDVDQSRDLETFDDIGAIHVDGETEEDRLKECIDICCHAGAGCNVVSLDKSITGKDGSNCHLFKCDPPEDCKWTIQENTQSALLSPPIKSTTTSQSPGDDVTTTPGIGSTSTTIVSDAEPADNATTSTPMAESASVSNETQSEVDVNATTPTQAESATGQSDPDNINATTPAPAVTTTEQSAGDVNATTPALAESATEQLLSATQTPANSSIEESAYSTATTSEVPERTNASTTENMDMTETTSASAATERSTSSPLPEDAMTSTSPTPATSSTSTESSTSPTSTVIMMTSSTEAFTASQSSTEDTPVLTSARGIARDTTTFISSTNTSIAPTTSISQEDLTPAPLRAKTADMSSTTVTALACALAAGAMFVGIVATIVGKRFYDNWHRRHYQQIDYLVDGMYDR